MFTTGERENAEKRCRPDWAAFLFWEQVHHRGHREGEERSLASLGTTRKGDRGGPPQKAVPANQKPRIGRVAGLQSKLGAAALVFYQEAEILDGQKAGGAGDFAGLGVDNTELEPDSFGANRNG